MWKLIDIDGVNFYIKCKQHDGNLYTIQLSDLISLWQEDIHKSELLQRCKELNKLLEASDEDLLENVFSLLDSERSNISRTFIHPETQRCEGKILSLQSSLDGFKFRIKLYLNTANATQFYNEITLPFLITMRELERRQNLLQEELKKKDREIKEYKSEGVNITRKSVETKAFNSEMFQEKCKKDLSTIKSVVTSHCFNALTPGVQQIMADIETAPLNTVQEVSSQVMKTERKAKLAHVKPTVTTNNKKKVYEDGDSDGNDEEIVKVKEEKITEAKEMSTKGSSPRKKTKLKRFNI